MYQAVTVPVRDGAKRLHAAGGDDHPRRLERTAGDRRAHVVGSVDLGRERLDLFARVRRLVEQRTGTRLADDQVRLDVRLAQPLEQADAVNHAGGTGDADNDPHWQIPNPKSQIPNPTKSRTAILGFGAWDLGFGISIKVLSTGCFVVSGPDP